MAAAFFIARTKDVGQNIFFLNRQVGTYYNLIYFHFNTLILLVQRQFAEYPLLHPSPFLAADSSELSRTLREIPIIIFIIQMAKLVQFQNFNRIARKNSKIYYIFVLIITYLLFFFIISSCNLGTVPVLSFKNVALFRKSAHQKSPSRGFLFSRYSRNC